MTSLPLLCAALLLAAEPVLQPIARPDQQMGRAVGDPVTHCVVPLELTIRRDGSVAAARVTDPRIKPWYARNAITNVRKWVYAPRADPLTLRMTLNYHTPDVPPARRRNCLRSAAEPPAR